MSRKRRKLGASLKSKMAPAAVRSDKTAAQLASEFGVHSQVTAWKKRLLEGLPELFADGRRKRLEASVSETELYEQIGWLEMELKWLKKIRRGWTEPAGTAERLTF